MYTLQVYTCETADVGALTNEVEVDPGLRLSVGRLREPLDAVLTAVGRVELAEAVRTPLNLHHGPRAAVDQLDVTVDVVDVSAANMRAETALVDKGQDATGADLVVKDHVLRTCKRDRGYR
eukprot:TRINITY_DN5760_c1_g1_i4.p2 TRINITY_DN5760_c1_g1~~TRINITY_DN5760_c1_g1_i4.p2  ORF type:complete len:121 (+),score=7.98 TRINITY_DN5760_c1_g1_i4:690-1052(+)